jgi:hypothetical protein
VSLFKCDLNKFPPKFILCSSITLTATQNQVCSTALHPQISLSRYRYFFPVPQLTPNCERVVMYGLLPLDGTDWNILHAIKLFILLMEIRISEDYCSSDIFVIDYSNLTLGHMSKVTPSYLKKFELCGFVSSTNFFPVINDSRN